MMSEPSACRGLVRAYRGGIRTSDVKFSESGDLVGVELFCAAHLVDRRNFLRRFEPEEIAPYVWPTLASDPVGGDTGLLQCKHRASGVTCTCARECALCGQTPDECAKMGACHGGCF